MMEMFPVPLDTQLVALAAALVLAGMVILAGRRRQARLFEEYGVEPKDWRALTGRRADLRGDAISGRPDAIFVERGGDRVMVARTAADPTNPRPRPDEIYELTLYMGLAAERWPDATVGGCLRHEDRVVPVAWSPTLFLALTGMTREYSNAVETGRAPDPRPLAARLTVG